MIREDTRKRYTELRYEAKGMIGDRLYVLIYCWRERVIRAISLRICLKKWELEPISEVYQLLRKK